MPKETFTWGINGDWSGQESPRVFTLKFGDSYEQRIGNGINTNPQKFDVTVTLPFSEMKDFREFLKRHGSVESFFWENPYEETGLYVVRKWKISRLNEESGALYIAELTLEQVFE